MKNRRSPLRAFVFFAMLWCCCGTSWAQGCPYACPPGLTCISRLCVHDRSSEPHLGDAKHCSGDSQCPPWQWCSLNLCVDQSKPCVEDSECPLLRKCESFHCVKPFARSKGSLGDHCVNGSDCLSGECLSYRCSRKDGDWCLSDFECPSGRCTAGKCEPTKKKWKPWANCKSDAECPGGTCSLGMCISLK